MTELAYANEPDASNAEQVVSQFVTFRLDDQHYGVDIMSVREIRMMTQLTAVPGAPDYVRGVLNLRGTLIPVTDLRFRFGQNKTEIGSNQPIVIVSVGGKPTGLLVDEVLDIISIKEDDLLPLPDAQKNEGNPFFDRIVSENDQVTIVVSLDKLFTEEIED